MELIEYLKNFNSETLIMKVEQHMETGMSLKPLYVREAQFVEEERHCFDSFDGCSYTTNVKSENFDSKKEGTNCLIV